MSDNLRLLQAMAEKPAALAWFRGLFADAHVEITDTGERFTVVHHGDSAEVLPGFQRPGANLVVGLTSANVANLAAIFEGDEVTPEEEYRIVRFMLRPCLEAALVMPILSNDLLLKVLRVDDQWQQALLDPQGQEDLPLTIQKTNGQWSVTEGFHGTPRRRLRLTAAQLLDFQRRLFQADTNDSLSGWLALAQWYVGWRDQVTVPVAGTP